MTDAEKKKEKKDFIKKWKNDQKELKKLQKKLKKLGKDEEYEESDVGMVDDMFSSWE